MLRGKGAIPSSKSKDCVLNFLQRERDHDCDEVADKRRDIIIESETSFPLFSNKEETEKKKMKRKKKLIRGQLLPSPQQNHPIQLALLSTSQR